MKEREMNPIVLRGVVRGKTIELHANPGISEGEEVEIVVRPAARQNEKPGEGLLRTEGALADDLEWDAIMEDVHQSRKQERRPQWEDA